MLAAEALKKEDENLKTEGNEDFNTAPDSTKQEKNAAENAVFDLDLAHDINNFDIPS